MMLGGKTGGSLFEVLETWIMLGLQKVVVHCVIRRFQIVLACWILAKAYQVDQ